MMVFVFWTAFVLIFVLLLVLLCSLAALFVKKYRRYLPKAVMICFVLFALLVAADFLMYRDFAAALNDPSAFVLDIHPLDVLLMISLNWHIPGIIILIAGTLILTRKTKKSVLFWICIGGAALLMCGLFVMTYDVICDWCGQEFHSLFWWI
ncbi:MAG: hypothetical protein JSW23_03725 [Planctomycetota bacterium]|nr:MAG: hypothetical protein JSW23_03725 [Planctomycetota bacterium]